MKQPVIFLGHGSPMNAIEENSFTRSWKEMGKKISVKPRAILMFSAHWITEGETRIQIGETHEMIYDMYGFPEGLYQVQYPCSGSSDIAKKIRETLKPEYSLVEDDKRGIDHGTWSTLIHLFPSADIPVIQLSIDYAKSPEWHYQFGKKLQILREQGILIVASGNMVHNLRAIDWSNTVVYPWAKEFHDRVYQNIKNKDYASLLDFQLWGEITRLSHPTIDHFLPLFPLLGAISETDTAEFYNHEVTMGSLSMTSVYWS